jgi:hypothetical protein
MPESDVRTVRIYGSRVVSLSGRRVALLLKTDRWGVVPFEVTQQTIEALRRDLVAAEKYLSQPIVRA